MLDIILMVVFGYTNSVLARRKNLNSGTWVLWTILAMFGGIFLGAIIISLTYKGAMDMKSVERFLMQNPLKIITVQVCEAGGGLLIRYLLEQKPDVPAKSNESSD